MRSRESRCCYPRSPPQIQNAACRHDHSHRRPKSVGDSITHLHIRKRHHERRSTRIEMRHRQNAVLLLRRKSGMRRHNRRRTKSFGGNFTHSRICRRRHDRHSTRIDSLHRQSDTRAIGRIRRQETASFKYPSITAAAAGIK